MKNVIEKRHIRAEVPTELTWDLSDLFESDKDWETALRVLTDDLKNLMRLKENYILVPLPYYIAYF